MLFVCCGGKSHVSSLLLNPLFLSPIPSVSLILLPCTLWFENDPTRFVLFSMPRGVGFQTGIMCLALHDRSLVVPSALKPLWYRWAESVLEVSEMWDILVFMARSTLFVLLKKEKKSYVDTFTRLDWSLWRFYPSLFQVYFLMTLKGFYSANQN